MQSEYRVKRIYTEEDGGVVAKCYDILYGEDFEKYLGFPDDFDGKENASNLLQDSTYEMSDELRAEIEELFNIAEFNDEQDYDGYQFFDFDDDFDDEDDDEDEMNQKALAMLGKRESFNLREALNQIDLNTDNKYDLLNLYESCDLKENEKRALANIVYDQEDPSVIYDTLNNRYVSGEEIGMPERVKDGVIHESSVVDDYTVDKEDDLGDDELNAFYKGYTEEDEDENSAYNKLKKNANSIKEDYEADTMTFAQWFDENQQHQDSKYYPFDNYVKTFENAEILRNATARDILNNAHIFYDLYDVDSADREKAFHFASELLGLDYDVFYDAWLSGSPAPGTNLEESKSTRKHNGKSLTEGFYRGCEGVTMIGHGEWSDPELEYDGYLFNYWDIEDALWNGFLDETGWTDVDGDEPVVENEFNEYVKARCVDYLDDCISGGAFTGLSIEGDIVDFPNGEYYYVGYEDGKISLDNAYNTGRAPEYSIDYDFDESIDTNLQRLYDYAIEKSPWLNGDDDLDESKSIKESDEETPYTKEEVERELKSITHNFTDKDGELKCGFEEEKNFGVEILKQHYKVVEASGDDRREGTWYHISYAEPIVKESLTHSPLSTSGTLPYAIKLLWEMDKFVLDVYDNESWLMNGVPDGEFYETTSEEAKQNWSDHQWLVIDEYGNENLDDFREFVDVFRRCTRSKDYDQEERNRIIAEAESLLHN